MIVCPGRRCHDGRRRPGERAAGPSRAGRRRRVGDPVTPGKSKIPEAEMRPRGSGKWCAILGLNQ